MKCIGPTAKFTGCESNHFYCKHRETNVIIERGLVSMVSIKGARSVTEESGSWDVQTKCLSRGESTD